MLTLKPVHACKASATANTSTNANVSYFNTREVSAENIKHAGAVEIFFQWQKKKTIRQAMVQILVNTFLAYACNFPVQAQAQGNKHFHSLRLRLLDSGSHVLALALHF